MLQRNSCDLRTFSARDTCKSEFQIYDGNAVAHQIGYDKFASIRSDRWDQRVGLHSRVVGTYLDSRDFALRGASNRKLDNNNGNGIASLGTVLSAAMGYDDVTPIGRGGKTPRRSAPAFQAAAPRQ